jgi:sucrose-6-phosphate hydrolase SacC (GH32 family)
VDRSASGAVDFGPSFGAPQFAPLKGSADRVAVHAFLDHSSLEIFINEGETVFTTVVFPAIPYDKISLTADRKIALDAGTLYELGSIWTH